MEAYSIYIFFELEAKRNLKAIKLLKITFVQKPYIPMSIKSLEIHFSIQCGKMLDVSLFAEIMANLID